MTNNLILSTYSLEQLQSVIRECIKEAQPSTAPPLTTDDNVLLDRKEARKLFNVSNVTLASWEKKGIIKSYKIATRIRYKKTELMQTFETQRKYGRTAK